VDQDILLDAGTGVGDLSLGELTLIDHIFVTHSHLDHVNSIAFFLDSVGALRPKPVTVYAPAPTIETLRSTCSTGTSGRISRRYPRRSSRGCATRRWKSGR
jgi:ribonuclease BN (tRNA processing enzyme)